MSFNSGRSDGALSSVGKNYQVFLLGKKDNYMTRNFKYNCTLMFREDKRDGMRLFDRRLEKVIFDFKTNDLVRIFEEPLSQKFSEKTMKNCLELNIKNTYNGDVGGIILCTRYQEDKYQIISDLIKRELSLLSNKNSTTNTRAENLFEHFYFDKRKMNFVEMFSQFNKRSNNKNSLSLVDSTFTFPSLNSRILKSYMVKIGFKPASFLEVASFSSEPSLFDGLLKKVISTNTTKPSVAGKDKSTNVTNLVEILKKGIKFPIPDSDDLPPKVKLNMTKLRRYMNETFSTKDKFLQQSKTSQVTYVDIFNRNR